MTSYFDDDVIKNRHFSNDDNFVSVLRMKTVDPLFERYQMELYEYNSQKVVWSFHFCWRQHIFDVKMKNDVTWRHVVGFSQNFVRLFLFIISYFCPSLKWIWCSKQKLLEIKNPAYQWVCVVQHFQTALKGSISIKYYDFFLLNIRRKDKTAHFQKIFPKNIQNRPKFNFSKLCGTTPPHWYANH